MASQEMKMPLGRLNAVWGYENGLSGDESTSGEVKHSIGWGDKIGFSGNEKAYMVVWGDENGLSGDEYPSQEMKRLLWR